MKNELLPTVKKDSIRNFFTNYMPEKINSTNFELYTSKYNSRIEEKTSNSVVSICNGNETIEKELSNICIYSEDDKKEQTVTEDVFVIDSDNEITKLNVLSKDIIEKETYDLDDGEYLIVGNGYGHGAGMSQYGAKGMAEKGFIANEIIKFYYTDVDIIHID